MVFESTSTDAEANFPLTHFWDFDEANSGVSSSPLEDPGAPGRGWALSQVTRGPRNDRRMGYTLRTHRWRYTEWDEGEHGHELYDHQTDPLEQTNLADDPAQAERIAELSLILREATADSLPESGEVPQIRPGIWAPNLTDP